MNLFDRLSSLLRQISHSTPLRITRSWLTVCPWGKVEFGITRLVIVLFLALVIVQSSRELIDLDFQLHLKTGQLIVTQRTVPLTDPYSFTLAGKTWINHEWLFQVIVYLVYSHFGPDGVLILQNLIACGFFSLLFLFAIRQKNSLFVLVFLYLTLMTVVYRFTVRPDLFSLFFLTLYMIVIHLYTRFRSRLMWFLPIFQILWGNIHGFSLIGPVLVLAPITAELIKRHKWFRRFSWSRLYRLSNRQVGELFLLFICLMISSCVTPNGIKGGFYSFGILNQVAGNGRIFFDYIEELKQPVTMNNIFSNRFLFFKVSIFISAMGFYLNRRRINLSIFLLWTLFLLIALLALRNIAYFAIIAFFANIANFSVFYMRLIRYIREKFSPQRVTLPALVILGYFFITGTLRLLNSHYFVFESYESKTALWEQAKSRFPEKAVDFLLENKLPQRFYNDFNSGAYLINRCYPKRQVFLDGRTELYGGSFFKDYVEAGKGKTDVINRLISKYDIQGFFLQITFNDLHSHLLKSLYLDPRWQVIYFDHQVIIFLKNTKTNASWIRRFAIDMKAWRPPQPNLLKLGITSRTPYPYLQRARLLNRLECHAAAAREARIALSIMPHEAEALRIMADYYYEQKKYLLAFQHIRNSLIYSSGNLVARCELALIYSALDDNDKALKVVNSIIKQRPRFAHGYYIKAKILSDRDKPEAIRLAKKATKLEPTIPRYQIFLGDLLEKEDPSQARKAWQEALRYEGGNPTIHQRLKRLKN